MTADPTADPAAGPAVDGVPGPPLAPTRPAYGVASLADVLPGALSVLGVPGVADPLGLRAALPDVRRVAVLLVDGLGWHQLPAAAPHAPALADLYAGRLGAARELTSGFPSTTPTSLVTLGTGAPPGAHGVLGFTLRRGPDSTEVLNHVRWRDEPNPAVWQPVPTRLRQAAEAGVSVTVAVPPEFAGSGLTVAAYSGAVLTGATGADAVAERMLAGLARPAPALAYGYLPDVDTAGHRAGVDSSAWRAAVRDLDRLLARLVDGLPPDAALLVTADHGQLDVPAHRRYDIAADPRLAAGVTVIAGEPRVRYLHTAPGAAPDVLAAWRTVLGDGVWVVGRDEAVDEGWFGPVAPAHLDRIGDVVAACRDDSAVLSSGTEPAEVGRLVAYHGSFTAVEMAVPLLTARR